MTEGLHLATCMTLAALIIAGQVSPATARQLPSQTPSQLRDICEAAGGAYFAPSSNGRYGCFFTASAVTCGGTGESTNACSNTAPEPRTIEPLRLPTSIGRIDPRQPAQHDIGSEFTEPMIP